MALSGKERGIRTDDEAFAAMNLQAAAWMSVFLVACTPSKQEPITDAASAQLLLERVEYSLGKNTLKPGTWMGTLAFGKGVPREMLLGPGMLGYTNQKTACRTEEP